MASNRLAFVLVTIACVGAAGVGSYVATRENVGRVAIPAAVAAVPVESAPAIAAVQTPPAPATGSMPASPVGERLVRLRPPEVPVRVAPARPRTAPAPANAPVEPVPHVVGTDETPANGPTALPAAPMAAEPAVLPAPVADVPAQTAVAEDRPAEAGSSPESPARLAHELEVVASSVIGIQTEGLITSEHARVEDRVDARVVRDVRVNGLVAIPAGTRVLGTVVVVERGGKVRERARLGIRFNTLLMPDGTRVAISTDPIYRFGESPSNGSAARIGGGAVAGAILGAILGGGKGAAIGATTGASAGAAAVMGGERNTATFPPGSEVTARILAPIVVSVERE